MIPAYRCLPGLVAMFAAMLFTSCTFPRFTSRSVTPYGSLKEAHRIFIESANIFPLSKGELLMVQSSLRADVRLMRLNDTLGINYEYLLPAGSMTQSFLGLRHHDGTITFLTAEYHYNGQMMAIARQLDASTGKVQKQDTLISTPRQRDPYYRSELDITFSKDSSQVLLYSFDLHRDASQPAMADALLYDLRTGSIDTMRFTIPIPEDVRGDAYYHYLPSQIVYQALLANDGRAYFVFPGNNDSLALAYADIAHRSSRSLALSLRSGPCNWGLSRYRRPGICIDPQGSIWLSALDYNDKNKATGISVARFSGASPGFDVIRHYPIDPATLSESILGEEVLDTFIMVSTLSNSTTGGCTVLFQRERAISESSTHFRSSGNPQELTTQRYVYGDIFGFAFDTHGEQVWGKTVAPNAFYILDRQGPFITAGENNDSVFVSYLGYGTNYMTQIRSSVVSARNGTGRMNNIADMGMNTYADLRRSFSYDNGSWLIYGDVTDRNSPELIHLRSKSRK